MPFFGMVALTLSAWLLTAITPNTANGQILWISGLLGLGASLTVTLGLLRAALSVAPSLVGRAIALVHLLRLSSAYLVAPVLVYLAQVGQRQAAPATAVGATRRLPGGFRVAARGHPGHHARLRGRRHEAAPSRPECLPGKGQTRFRVATDQKTSRLETRVAVPAPRSHSVVYTPERVP